MPALSEFDIIRDIFSSQTPPRDGVAVGIGDDAALLDIPAGQQLAASVDTFNPGVHFPEHTAPSDIGHKAMAAALSDLAAMGATPLGATLSLSLPFADKPWLADFARGFFSVARQFDTQLIGGDTTRGPLSISVGVFGTVPRAKAMRRAGARPGDSVYVTGALGAAAAALLALRGEIKTNRRQEAALAKQLNRPTPAVAAGLFIRDYARACIDISDGLAADLGHILRLSGVGARIHAADIPMHDAARECLEPAAALSAVLHGGDDYELCFTVATDKRDEMESAARKRGITLTRIGVIEPAAGLRLVGAGGAMRDIEPSGYEHFKSA